MAEKEPGNQAPELIPLDYLKEVAECLKCIAHPQRLRIIEILRKGEYSVDEVARMCNISQPATSGHLRLMSAKGLLHSTRRGRTVFYSVAEKQLESIIGCIASKYSEKRKADLVKGEKYEDR